jgi:flagellar biosynthetic protein FliR
VTSLPGLEGLPGGLASFFLAEAAAYVLAVSRVAGFVLTSPFPGKNVPAKGKIGLVLMLAFLARAVHPAARGLNLDLLLLGIVPSEIGIGLVIGFTVRITFSAAEILGLSLAQSTGLTMGAVYDPNLGNEDPLPARIINLFAMLLFVALGSHRVAIAYTLESFRALPIGNGAAIEAALPSFVGFLAQAMEAGVRLSLPVMGIALAIQVTLALVARASPSLQVFSIGMGVTVAAGILAILGSLGDTAAGVGHELQREGPRIEQVLQDVSPGRP